MNILIWDLDYYYATNKTNIFNTDAMKVSSYHKQLEDNVMLVESEYDLSKPYDILYIFKNNPKTPAPPSRYYVNAKVKWWGKAAKHQIHWRMSDTMLGCRPDYLLYPDHKTTLEQAEQLRMFNNKAEPLSWIQDWSNTFRNKSVLVTDYYMWCATKENIINALKRLQQYEKVSFLEPIWIQKLISDKDIMEEFLKINFDKKAHFSWSLINFTHLTDAIELFKTLREKLPRASIDTLVVDYHLKTNKSHWEDKNSALSDFADVRRWIMFAKQQNLRIKLKLPKTRFETPYFELFEFLCKWTQNCFSMSFLEYITHIFSHTSAVNYPEYWNHPEKWHPVFRQLLLQTYNYPEFLLHKMADKKVSEVLIPWNKWKEEFAYEI